MVPAQREKALVVPPTVIPLPEGLAVHSILSPSFEIAPPEVLHGELMATDLMQAMQATWKTRQQERVIAFHSVRDVYVVGEGLVFDSNLNLLEPSVTQLPESAIAAGFASLKAALVDGSVDRHRGPILLCGKAGLNNYGHWLVEMLPRAYLTREWINRDGGWRVLVPHVYPWMAGVVADSLDLLDVTANRRILNTGQPCYVQELVMVTGMTQHGQYFSPLILEAMDAIADRVPAASYDRIWMTRAGETRSLLDEAQANTHIAAAGWHVAKPGALSFRDQVALAKGARHMAGVNGAGLSNLVFMRPGGTLTSFVPAVMPDVFYWQLSGHRGLTYREIRSAQRHDLGGPTLWDAPLTIAMNEVLCHLERISSK